MISFNLYRRPDGSIAGTLTSYDRADPLSSTTARVAYPDAETAAIRAGLTEPGYEVRLEGELVRTYDDWNPAGSRRFVRDLIAFAGFCARPFRRAS